MAVITDIVLATPIGIIYNMIIHECADTFNNSLGYKEKIQRNLLFVFGGGLMGFLIAYFLTTNTALKYGMYLGALLLMSHSVLYNWITMQNDTRIIVMILSLVVLIWFAYTQNPENTSIKKSNKKKQNESDDYVEEDGNKLSSLLPMTFTKYEQYKNRYDDDDL